MSVQTSTMNLRIRSREYPLSVRFRESGDELVLFVHGLGCSKENWRDAWSRPELRDRSLLAPDLPGFGHSPCPTDFSADLSGYAQIIHALIDAHAVRRIHLVAHSMGGSACLLLPDRVLARLESFVLIEPRIFLSSCAVASVAVGVTYEEFTATVFPAIHRQLSRDSRMAYDLGRADIRAFYNSSQSLIDWTSRRALLERYELADCRKYFVYGAENGQLQELSFIRPTVSVESAAHFVMRDNPDGFYTCLARILDNL